MSPSFTLEYLRLRDIVTYACTEPAEKWWKRFEAECIPEVVEETLRQLYLRKATLEEYWLVYVYSFEDNIKIILEKLDEWKRKIGNRVLIPEDFKDEKGDPITTS